MTDRLTNLVNATLAGDLISARDLVFSLGEAGDYRASRLLVELNRLLRTHQTVRVWFGFEMESHRERRHREELIERRDRELVQAWERFRCAVADRMAFRVSDAQLERASRDFKAARKAVGEGS